MPSDLSKNLRLLCSYHKSIADICRRLKINRPQFNRYLNGQTQPSLRLMRKLCDFFGVEESELFLPHGQFSELVRLKPQGDRTTIERNMAITIAEEILVSSQSKLDPYVGFYFSYYYSMSSPGKILRGLVQLYISPFGGRVKILEPILVRKDGNQKGFTCKYEGVAFILGDRIFISTLEMLTRNEISQTILYPSYKNRIRYLHGIMSGVSAHATRNPAATRILYEYLGKSVDKKKCLKKCGLFDSEDEDIPQDIVNSIGAKTDSDSKLMLATTT